MNTNNLKRFAQETRRKLLEQVDARLTFILNADTVLLREKTDQIKQLREELSKTPKAQLIEKVAYTWFNRFMALRFMDANDYQPLGIKIITPKDGNTISELLDEAKKGNIPAELKVNQKRVFDLLDNRILSSNPQNEAFKELLIAACNHLSSVLPFLFERINDYTELLLPEDLTSDFSIVTDVREGMPIKDCVNVEIIGWLYQFYISEEKDRLINAKKVYKSFEIAPVTQLFTPKWIVQYMVDNTLGQLWKEARPKTNITKDLEFYIKPENEAIIPRREVKSPEEITFFDPCVGSAHILCYAFDVFFKIYEEEGYSISEIPEHIIGKNLYGIDIDDRAAQLACFALMMKGRQYDRRFLKKGIHLNITSFQNIESHPKFLNAKTLGSLINIDKSEVDKIVIDSSSIFAEQQYQLKTQASLLSNRYDIVVTNPPYLNSSYMDGELKQFVEKQYPSTKSDLFACFLIQATNLTKKEGLIGFISPFVWMFISSYEKLRLFVIDKTTITSLIQLEYNAFEPACVPIATFTLKNQSYNSFKGSYIKLSDFKGHECQAPKTVEAINNPNCGWFNTSNQNDYKKISGSPIGYWLSKKTYELWEKEENFNQFGDTRQGLITSNNERFLRYHFEVSRIETCYDASSYEDSVQRSEKWFPYNKGGSYRKWFGNFDYLLNWKNDGFEIRNFRHSNGSQRSVTRDSSYYFLEAITWSDITSGNISFRFCPKGIMFGNKGNCAFGGDYQWKLSLLAYGNTKFLQEMAKLINPTLTFSVGDFNRLIYAKKFWSKGVSDISEDCVNISKIEWNSHETSWDFLQNELIRVQGQDIEESYDLYQQFWKNKFFQLHNNEEKLNRIFIEIYDLKEELTPNVPLEEITILKNETVIENGQLVFKASEVFAQFISYAVGCMFGRYSLIKEGLVLANEGESLQDFLNKIEKINECSFLPDEDNIIPVLDDEWFEDDIVGRFNQFLKMTFGEKNFTKNLAFIEEQIGKDIRKYFTKDFYADHIQRYKKRPIYWMFSSLKGSFNVLIYIHRYTPDTVSNILNKYLRELINKIKTRKEYLNHTTEVGSPSEKAKAIKEIDSIDKVLIELRDYERDVLYPLAIERIPIDLDDGVLVNYNKFGKAVKEVVGLNDKKTKEAVKKFDWIDTSQIR